MIDGGGRIIPWTFVHATDIHVGSPRSFRFEPAWNENWATARRQFLQLQPDLLFVGGDLTRDGNLHAYEFESIKADLDTLTFPYHVIPGNMDTGNKHTRMPSSQEDRDDIALNVSSQQLQTFEMFFGPWCWTFVHKEVRFTGFYEAVAGSELPEEDAFWRWLETLPDQPRGCYHVVVTHYPLFIDSMDEREFDITSPADYHNWYFAIDHPHRSRIFDVLKAADVDVVISGHIHCRRPAQEVAGIRFFKAPSTAFSQWTDRWSDGDGTLGFLCFDVAESGITDRFVALEQVSTAKGYGPGGHPKPETRDYSVSVRREVSGGNHETREKD